MEITREEFLKAVDIVNEYKSFILNQTEQLKNDLTKKEFSHLILTKDTKIIDSGLSVRCINALYRDYNTLGDLHLIGNEIYNFRNLGKKGIQEIQKCALEAGVLLNI